MKTKILSGLVMLLIIIGCKKTNEIDQTNIVNNQKLVAAFKINNFAYDNVILEGNVVEFSNDSKNAVSYIWTLGKCYISSEKEPKNETFHPCDSILTLKLTVVGKTGETASSSQEIKVLCRGNNYHNTGKVLPPTHYNTEEIKKYLPNGL